jgi:chromosome segregation ATPase
MKNQIGIIVLVLICLGLGIALIALKKQTTEQLRQDSVSILNLSNSWTKTEADLQDQKLTNANLEKDNEAQKKSLGELTNNLTQATENLAKRDADLKATQEAMAKRDAKISELEAQNQALDKKSEDLNADIGTLNQQISDTKAKLAASEGDKAFLEKELKRMLAEQTELKRQFSDLAVLRAQVSKLKEEMATRRRQEWRDAGVFARTDQKGGQRLMTLANPPPAAPTVRTNYDLNVEVSADGSVRVIPPITNRPTTTQ